jgi:hypothetical protein
MPERSAESEEACGTYFQENHLGEPDPYTSNIWRLGWDAAMKAKTTPIPTALATTPE